MKIFHATWPRSACWPNEPSSWCWTKDNFCSGSCNDFGYSESGINYQVHSEWFTPMIQLKFQWA